MTRRKLFAALGVAVILIPFMGMVASGTYLSNLIRDGGLVPKPDELIYDLVVIEVNSGYIVMELAENVNEAAFVGERGTLGLMGEDSNVLVGDIYQIESDDKIRRRILNAYAFPEAGDSVRLEGRAYQGDPFTAHGIPFETVSIASPVGEFPAWFIDGGDDTWVITVHGRNSDPGGALRAIPTLVERDMPVLAISYRNDPGLPTSEDGFHRYGLTEWEEVDAAVRYALNNGAEDVVLVGYSMGGGIVANFMYQSDLADSVAALVLDSPMLHLGRTVDWGGQQMGYSQVILDYAKLSATVRFGVDFPATDYLSRADELEVPVLLFHGRDDETVPISISEDFAAARPDIVTPFFTEGGHVLSWNHNPEAYEKALSEFLADIPD